MTSFRHLSAALAVTLLLAACGGGGSDDGPRELGPSGAPTTAGTFTSVVSFGDSLSDVGTYTPATSLTGNGAPPFFAGKFTTNVKNDAAAGQIWIERIATALGLAVTPAEIGFFGQSQLCPAAAGGPAAAATCTAYGQGGARVTDPNGIGKTGGALTVPVRTQIANHLARKGDFTANDLVFVFGGNNDVLLQFLTFAGKAGAINAQAAAGQITPAQAQVLLLTAQVEADTAVKLAAQELAASVVTDVLGHGARYVAVLNVADFALTPLGRSLPTDSARGVVTGLARTFNTALREGLDRQPVAIFDFASWLAGVIANPTAGGYTNVTVPACDASIISAITGGRVTDGSSLFCNADVGVPYSGLRAGASRDTWAFADSIHPTVGGHRGISDFVGAELAELGWIVD